MYPGCIWNTHLLRRCRASRRYDSFNNALCKMCLIIIFALFVLTAAYFAVYLLSLTILIRTFMFVVFVCNVEGFFFLVQLQCYGAFPLPLKRWIQRASAQWHYILEQAESHWYDAHHLSALTRVVTLINVSYVPVINSDTSSDWAAVNSWSMIINGL